MFRSKGVVVALSILSVCAFSAGCGGEDGAADDEIQQAQEDGAKEAEAQAKLDQLQEQIDQLSKPDDPDSDDSNSSSGSVPTSVAPSDFTECTDGVKAGPNTSCEFAMNVAGEYGSNPGATSITAYSPATDEQYTLACAASGDGTVCSGGNGASVFIP